MATLCDGHNASQLGGQRRGCVLQYHCRLQLAPLSGKKPPHRQGAEKEGAAGGKSPAQRCPVSPLPSEGGRETRFERLREAPQEISLYWIPGR